MDDPNSELSNSIVEFWFLNLSGSEDFQSVFLFLFFFFFNFYF